MTDNKLKEIYVKYTYYHLNDIINMNDLGFRNIVIDKK